jgi:translation elongation factor P/translation initiation factor 5A
LEGGDYHTTNWGRLATIEESTLQVGSVVQIQNEPYEVIANKSTIGNAHVPSNTWFVALKVDA